MIELPRKYSQNDPRWKNILLGNNTDAKFTIGNYGCLITCLAMASCYYGQEITPDEINDDLKSVGGFAGGGDYVWNSVEKIVDMQENFFRTPLKLTDVQVVDIKDQIDAGYPVMLEIDSVPSTSGLDMHFVLAVAYSTTDENDFTIVDPWDGLQKSLKKYLGWFRPSMRDTVWGYSVLIGKVTDLINLKATEITWDDFEGNRHTVEWYVYEWALEKQRANKEALKRIDIEQNYADYKEKINTVIADKDTAYNDMVSSFNTKLTQRDKTIGTLETKVKKLEDKIIAMQEEVPSYDIPQSVAFLIEAIKKAVSRK